MSAIPDIIAQVRAAGGRVIIIEDRLKVRAPLPLPDKLVAELRLHKAELMAFLQDRKAAWTPEDWRAFFDERAGIAEHDGGLSRDDAERQAFECCVMEWRCQPKSSKHRDCLCPAPRRPVGVTAAMQPRMPAGAREEGQAVPSRFAYGLTAMGAPLRP